MKHIATGLAANTPILLARVPSNLSSSEVVIQNNSVNVVMVGGADLSAAKPGATIDPNTSGVFAASVGELWLLCASVCPANSIVALASDLVELLPA